MNQQTKEWYISRARKHSSVSIVKAMRDKYLKELDELLQKPEWERGDRARAKELKQVLVTLTKVE